MTAPETHEDWTPEYDAEMPNDFFLMGIGPEGLDWDALEAWEQELLLGRDEE